MSSEPMKSQLVTLRYTHPTSAMQQLKMATKVQHQKIESQLNLNNLGASIESYRHLLRGYHGFYQPVEYTLCALPWHVIDFAFAARQKTALLQQDLLDLGDSNDAIAALPLCDSLPALPTLAQGFGCLYVLEGSTLGGQVIIRHLQKQLSMTPTMGGSFFYGYGNALGVMWKSFGLALDAFAEANPDALPRMIATACDTFESLQRWLRNRELIDDIA